MSDPEPTRFTSEDINDLLYGTSAELPPPPPPPSSSNIDDLLVGPEEAETGSIVPLSGSPVTEDTTAGTGSIVPLSGSPFEDADDLAAFEAATVAEFTEASLADLEDEIGSGLRGFVRVGLALAAVRERKLYRETHDSFEDYCRDRWDFTGRRARQLITSASVVLDLDSDSPPPTNEAQARELAKVPADQRNDVWDEAQAQAAEEDRPVTAKDVRTSASGAAPVSSAPSSLPSPEKADELPSAEDEAGDPAPVPAPPSTSSSNDEPAASLNEPAALLKRIESHVTPLTKIQAKQVRREATTPFARSRVLSLTAELEDWAKSVRAALALAPVPAREDDAPEDDA